MAVRRKKTLSQRKVARPRFGVHRQKARWIERDYIVNFSLYT